MKSNIDQIIRQRHSIRAFLPTPIPNQIIKDILDTARFAPSGSNTQPWQVYVVSNTTREKLIQNVAQALLEEETFSYYPPKWVSPFIERRRQNGWALYGLLNIKKFNNNSNAIF